MEQELQRIKDSMSAMREGFRAYLEDSKPQPNLSKEMMGVGQAIEDLADYIHNFNRRAFGDRF